MPELFIDHKGKYWEVPESVSLDCSSLVSESGLRYRFGIHRNSCPPHAVDSSDSETPLTLMPGVCVKAAFSYEKNKDLWRQKEKKEDVIIETDQGRFWRPSYDIRLREPHAAVSGIIGNFDVSQNSLVVNSCVLYLIYLYECNLVGFCMLNLQGVESNAAEFLSWLPTSGI